MVGTVGPQQNTCAQNSVRKGIHNSVRVVPQILLRPHVNAHIHTYVRNDMCAAERIICVSVNEMVLLHV